MVAFKVNKKASNLKSEPTDNGGIDDLAKDFRYLDNPKIETIYKIQKLFIFLKHIQIFKAVAKGLKRFLLKYSANRQFKANRYFK